MTQHEPHPMHVEKVDAISAGTAQPLLTPGTNLSGIYKNLRTPGATTEYQLYNLLLRRIEEGKPVHWNSVREEVMGVLKAHQDWYKAVLIRMLEKKWIDTPEQPQPNAPVVQKEKVNFIDALAEDFYNGVSEASISDEGRGVWRDHLLRVQDPYLRAACMWYMEQLQEGQPHSPDDWINVVAAQQEVSRQAEGTGKQQLREAIEYLERKGFIIEIYETALFEGDIDVDDMVKEIDTMEGITKGKVRLVPGDMSKLESIVQRYRQDLAQGRNPRVRIVKATLLEHVRDGKGTAWSDIYAASKTELDTSGVSEESAKDTYLDAVGEYRDKKIITAEQQE
ncbi:MAG: hypothetical protein AAB544_00125 [Patescibacteria group bacterium]